MNRCLNNNYACEYFQYWNVTDICVFTNMRNSIWRPFYDSMTPSNWLKYCPCFKKVSAYLYFKYISSKIGTDIDAYSILIEKNSTSDCGFIEQCHNQHQRDNEFLLGGCKIPLADTSKNLRQTKRQAKLPLFDILHYVV